MSLCTILQAHYSNVTCLPVVFPDFGGPRTDSIMGTAGPGGHWEIYFRGVSMNRSRSESDERKYMYWPKMTGNC